jgi:hypothetical protein
VICDLEILGHDDSEISPLPISKCCGRNARPEAKIFSVTRIL